MAQGTHPVTGYPQCDFTGESIVLEKRSDLLSHNISSAMAAQASASARA